MHNQKSKRLVTLEIERNDLTKKGKDKDILRHWKIIANSCTRDANSSSKEYLFPSSLLIRWSKMTNNRVKLNKYTPTWKSVLKQGPRCWSSDCLSATEEQSASQRSSWKVKVPTCCQKYPTLSCNLWASDKNSETHSGLELTSEAHMKYFRFGPE